MKRRTYEKFQQAKGRSALFPDGTLHNMDNLRGWEAYLAQIKSYDDDLATIMTGHLDSLLVFGGLFSAVVTTFLVDLRMDLDKDPAHNPNNLIYRLRYGSWVPDFVLGMFYAPLPRWTESLWWLSLALTLCSVLGATIAKEYIFRYSQDSLSGKPTRNALSHIVRVAGITRWYLRTIINLLPVILHVALSLFLVGCVISIQWDKVPVLALTLLCGGACLYGSRLLIHTHNAIPGVELRTSSDGIMSFFTFDVASLPESNQSTRAVASALSHALSTLNPKTDSYSLRIRTTEKGTLLFKKMAAFPAWCLSECIRNPRDIGSPRETDPDAMTGHNPSYFYAMYRLVRERSPPTVIIRGPWMFRMKPVALELPRKIYSFTNKSIAAESFIRTNQDSIPNLTGHINIVKGPLFPGGFSDIYSGEFTSSRGTEKVAMKMLRIFSSEAHMVKAKKKFRREVNMWCSLKHPHVLPFYGTCELDEFRIFMVSPWAQGGSSLEYLRRNPFADRNKILLQTASALEYLHSGTHAPPIVHGDLKADNVLISVTGDALLADFGLSVHVEEILSLSGSSSTGRAGGNPRFMAPELLLPPKNTSDISRPTRESDVFSFACLMLQLFTGQVPFAYLRREVQAIMEIVNGKLPPRPTDLVVLERGCSDRVWSLMTECWRVNPSERPNMTEIRMRMVARGRAVL